MFSITTMASSTTMPVASTMPNSVSVLIEKSNSFTNAKVPIERDRDRDRRNERAAPVLEEQEHHEDDEHDRLAERLQHLDDRFAHDDDVVEREAPLEPRREVPLEARHLGHDALVDVERVGRRQELDADAGRVEPDEAQVRGVGFGAELDAADVADAHERAVGAGLHDDALELVDLGEAARGADADLNIWSASAGASPTRPAATCTFCSRSAVTTSPAEICRAASFSGSSHSRIAYLRSPKMMHVADARHALDRVADVEVDVVADERAS